MLITPLLPSQEPAPSCSDGARSCASGSDREFSDYISDCRCFSHAGVGTKGCIHVAALFPCSVYLGIQLLLNADAHEARLWPGKAGRQILLRRSKAARSERWKTTEKRGAASPEDTHRGTETGKAPSRASKQHHSFLPAADVAGQCARPEMPSRQPGTESGCNPSQCTWGARAVGQLPEPSGAVWWRLPMLVSNPCIQLQLIVP